MAWYYWVYSVVSALLLMFFMGAWLGRYGLAKSLLNALIVATLWPLFPLLMAFQAGQGYWAAHEKRKGS